MPRWGNTRRNLTKCLPSLPTNFACLTQAELEEEVMDQTSCDDHNHITLCLICYQRFRIVDSKTDINAELDETDESHAEDYNVKNNQQANLHILTLLTKLLKINVNFIQDSSDSGPLFCTSCTEIVQNLLHCQKQFEFYENQICETVQNIRHMILESKQETETEVNIPKMVKELRDQVVKEYSVADDGHTGLTPGRPFIDEVVVKEEKFSPIPSENFNLENTDLDVSVNEDLSTSGVELIHGPLEDCKPYPIVKLERLSEEQIIFLSNKMPAEIKIEMDPCEIEETLVNEREQEAAGDSTLNNSDEPNSFPNPDDDSIPKKFYYFQNRKKKRKRKWDPFDSDFTDDESEIHSDDNAWSDSEEFKTLMKKQQDNPSCPYCPETFTQNQRQQYKNHLKSVHAAEVYKCTICGKPGKNYGTLQGHLKTHNPGSYWLSLDESRRKQLNDIREQRRQRAYLQQNPSCVYCPERFVKKSLYDKHLNTIHANIVFKCNICEKPGKSSSTLKRHLWTHKSKEEIEALESKGIHPPKIIPKAKPTSSSASSKNLCSTCGKLLSSKESLALHQLSQHGGTENKFLCTQCPRSFKLKTCLHRHMKSVHPIDPHKFKCLTCPKTFPTKQKFQNHSRIHLTIKPLKCRFCEKRFASRDNNIYRHERTHLEDRPKHPCPHCELSFLESKYLKQHLKNKHKNS